MKIVLLAIVSAFSAAFGADTYRLSAYKLEPEESSKITTQVLALDEINPLLLDSTIRDFIFVDLELDVPNETKREGIVFELPSYQYDEATQTFYTIKTDDIVAGTSLSAKISKAKYDLILVEFTLNFERAIKWKATEESPLFPYPIFDNTATESRIMLSLDTGMIVGGIADASNSEKRGYCHLLVLTKAPANSPAPDAPVSNR